MPNRLIRESCRTSETLDQLSDGAERMFWRLTTVADDHGRFEADPRILLGICFPLRIGRLPLSTVSKWIQEMVGAGGIVLYEAAGKGYGYFPTWAKHQRARAIHSKYPDPPSSADIGGHRRQSAALSVSVSVSESVSEEEGVPNGTLSDPPPADPDAAPLDPVKESEIQQVYRHYLAARGLSEDAYKLTRHRKQKIRTRLKDFTADALCAAIDACLASEWHMGKNDRAELFCDLADHIFKSEEKVERWLQRGRGK